MTTVTHCYILLATGGMAMHIIINHSSMDPIYEKIVSQINAEVISDSLHAGEALPSVRTLARELKISPLTVRRVAGGLEV